MTVEASDAEVIAALDAADAAADGNKELTYSQTWRTRFGANPVILAEQDTGSGYETRWSASILGSLPIVGTALQIPETVANAALDAAIGTGTWKFVVHKQGDRNVYQRVDLTPAAGTGEMKASGDFTSGAPSIVSSTLILPPTLDTVGTTAYPGASDPRRFAWVDPGDAFALVPDNVGAVNALYPWAQFSDAYWGYTKPLRAIPEPGVLSGYAGEYHLQRVANPSGGARQVFKHRIDPNYPTLAGTERAQFLTPYLNDDEVYWIGFSLRLDPDCANTPTLAGTAGDGINLFDLHATGGAQVQSPLNLYYTASSDTFYLERRGFFAGVLSVSGWTSPAAPGFAVWHHFVLRVRLTRTTPANGLLQAWWAVGAGTKTQVFDMAGSMFGFSDMDPNTVFPKCGLYRWARDLRATMHSAGLFIFRDLPGTPTLTSDVMLALLRSRIA